MDIYIYVLTDPITELIRYVGQTKNIKNRFYKHLNEAKSYKSKSHKDNWLRSLLKYDLKPIISVIDIKTKDTWVDAEIHYINLFRHLGYDLTINTSGR